MPTKTILLTLDAKQADDMLTAFGGEEIDPETGIVTRVVERAKQPTGGAVKPPRMPRRVVRSSYMG